MGVCPFIFYYFGFNDIDLNKRRRILSFELDNNINGKDRKSFKTQRKKSHNLFRESFFSDNKNDIYYSYLPSDLGKSSFSNSSFSINNEDKDRDEMIKFKDD
jgi:hypothetical protein